MLLALLLFAAADPTLLVDRADVLRYQLKGVSGVAVHEVTDTAGKTEKQVYSIVNHVEGGSSVIVISSENNDINGTVYLIKGSVLYAAAPNQRSFVRLGGLNLDRRIAGSLFTHWDLQGTLTPGQEYRASLASEDAKSAVVELSAKPGSQYQRMLATIDLRSGLLQSLQVFDAKGLLKTATYSKPLRLGGKIKRKLPTLIEMQRAPDRSDLPVPRTRLQLVEVEFDPEIDYGLELAVTDANLQRLRARYLLSAERRSAVLAEADE